MGWRTSAASRRYGQQPPRESLTLVRLLRRRCANAEQFGIRQRIYGSGGGAVVVVQHAAQALAALGLTCVAEIARLWADELVRQALMMTLAAMRGSNLANTEEHTWRSLAGGRIPLCSSWSVRVPTGSLPGQSACNEIPMRRSCGRLRLKRTQPATHHLGA